jgi:hypothetical protein
VALICLCLVLVFSAVETTHAHSSSTASAGSGCAICVSVHANAPALSFYTLLTAIKVEFLASPYQVEGKDFSREPSLFIRPPPFA